MRVPSAILILLTSAGLSAADETADRDAARALFIAEFESQPQIPVAKHVPFADCLLDAMTDAEVAAFLAASSHSDKQVVLNNVANETGMMMCDLSLSE